MKTSCQSLIEEQQQQEYDKVEGQSLEVTHLLNLPDDVLLHILQYLTLTPVGHCAMTCRRMCQLTWDDLLWKSLFLRHYKLAKGTTLAPRAESWRSEFRRLHDLTPSILCETRKDHRDEVLHVSFSGDGNMFATCSKDGFVKVWDSYTFPARRLFNMDMERRFNWKFTQFSQFNATCSCLLVSGVYMGPGSTSGEIAVFNIHDGFKLQCRVMNKPYDVFGAWYDDRHLLSGTLLWTDNGNSVSAIWLSKASQEIDSVKDAVSLMLFRFENKNSSSIRLIHVAETRDLPVEVSKKEEVGEASALTFTQTKPQTVPAHSSYLDSLLVKQNLRPPRPKIDSDSDSSDPIDMDHEFDEFMNHYTQGDYRKNPDKYKKRREIEEASALAEAQREEAAYQKKYQEEMFQEMSKKLGSWPTDFDLTNKDPTVNQLPRQVSKSTPAVSHDIHQNQTKHSEACSNIPSTSQFNEELLNMLPSSSSIPVSCFGANSNIKQTPSESVEEQMMLQNDYSPIGFENRSNSNNKCDIENIATYPSKPGSGALYKESEGTHEVFARDSNTNRVSTPSEPSTVDIFDSDAEEDQPLNNSSHAATQTAPPPPRAPSPRSLRGRLRSGDQGSSVSEMDKGSVLSVSVPDRLLIYTWGSETYIPHKIGIKRITHLDLNKDKVCLQSLPDHNSANIQVPEFESPYDRGVRDMPDHTIEMHGHIVGLCLSPDHSKLFVNCRPWPPGYIIDDPMDTPAVAQEIEITAFDLGTFERVGPVLRSHKAYTSSEQCFFLNLCASHQYCASGAEDKHAHLWDIHYGNRLYTFPHDNVVNCVASNPIDPQMLVTVSDDFTIKRWCSRHRIRQLRQAGLITD